MAPAFAYDPAGTLLVSGDGPEIIGYHGDTEAPLFRFVNDAKVLSLQIANGVVWALDEKNRLLWLTSEGVLLGQAELPSGARSLSPVRNARATVVVDGGAVVLDRDGKQSRLHHPNATAAALDVSGSNVLVGDGSGTLALYKNDGIKVTSLTLPQGVSISTVATAPGCWFAACGAKVYRGDDSLKWSEIFVTITGEEVEALATEDSKRLVAARMKGNKAIVLAAGRQKLASGRWLDKDVGQMGFGPLPWFGVGLSGGDGNKVNLITGAIHRTDTHPEREHHRWMLSFGAEEDNQPVLEANPPPLMAPANAPAAPPAPAKQAPPPPPPAQSSGLTRPPAPPAPVKKPIPPVLIGVVTTVVALPLLCMVFALLAALFKK
ncbi:MAG: hypothetical protein QM723_23860 [Myxococcaceae bacterium]